MGTGAWQWIDADEPARTVRTPGTVVGTTTRVVGSGRTESGFVTVSFTVDGTERRATIRVGELGDRYAVGAAVDLVYESSNPDRVTLDGVPAPHSGVPAAGLCGLGALVAIAGAVGARKVYWMHRIVGRYAWVPVDSSFVETEVSGGLRERSHLLLMLRDDTGTVFVERVDLGVIPPSLEPVAWVAGLGRPRFVVAPPGGAPLIPVKPVRRLPRPHASDKAA
jgi:hypothetical protein